MPIPRTPLASISGNRRRTNNLSEMERGQLISARRFGGTLQAIADEFKLPKSTVQSSLQIDRIVTKGKDLPRSSAPKTYSYVDYRNVLRFIRTTPKASYAAVRAYIRKDMCNKTIHRFLDLYGISNWRAKCRPYLTEEVAVKRLAWCLVRRHWTVEN